MEKEITRKSIFLSAWKNKIGYSLNYKDFDELETIIDYYETQLKKQKEIIKKAIEYIKSKENGKCIHNAIEKGAYTFVLDFDEAREFIWKLLQILEDKEV